MKKIVKLIKKNNNQYKILLSDGVSLSFYNEVIIYYNLLSNKVIDSKLLKEINAYNNLYTAYYESLRLIKIRLRTEKELNNLLSKKNYSLKERDFAIAKLKKQGYLNEDLYLKCFINDAYNIRGIGPNKIKFELQKLGIDETKIDNYLKLYATKWLDKIKDIVKKEVKTNHNNSNKVLELKIKNKLYNLGFYQDDINKYVVINNNDQKILNNIFKKELSKLQKKYNNEELKNKLKAKLYQKGFNITDIDTLINNNNL